MFTHTHIYPFCPFHAAVTNISSSRALIGVPLDGVIRDSTNSFTGLIVLGEATMVIQTF